MSIIYSINFADMKRLERIFITPSVILCLKIIYVQVTDIYKHE